MTVGFGPAVDDRRSVAFIAIRPNGSRRKNVLRSHALAIFRCFFFSFFVFNNTKSDTGPIILSPPENAGEFAHYDTFECKTVLQSILLAKDNFISFRNHLKSINQLNKRKPKRNSSSATQPFQSQPVR